MASLREDPITSRTVGIGIGIGRNKKNDYQVMKRWQKEKERMKEFNKFIEEWKKKTAKFIRSNNFASLPLS